MEGNGMAGLVWMLQPLRCLVLLPKLAQTVKSHCFQATTVWGATVSVLGITVSSGRVNVEERRSCGRIDRFVCAGVRFVSLSLPFYALTPLTCSPPQVPPSFPPSLPQSSKQESHQPPLSSVTLCCVTISPFFLGALLCSLCVVSG